MINQIKTIYYNTVAFSASAVAFGYIQFQIQSSMVKFPVNPCPLRWNIRGCKGAKRPFETDTQYSKQSVKPA